MELIDTFELARRLGRHPESVIRWRRLRKGPPYIRINGRVRYDWCAVSREWLAPQSVAAVLPPNASHARRVAAESRPQA